MDNSGESRAIPLSIKLLPAGGAFYFLSHAASFLAGILRARNGS